MNIGFSCIPNWRLGLLNLPLLPRSMSPFRLLFSMKVLPPVPLRAANSQNVGVVFCLTLSLVWLLRVVHGPDCSFQPKAMPASLLKCDLVGALQANVTKEPVSHFYVLVKLNDHAFVFDEQIWCWVKILPKLLSGTETTQPPTHTCTHAHTHNPRNWKS